MSQHVGHSIGWLFGLLEPFLELDLLLLILLYLSSIFDQSSIHRHFCNSAKKESPYQRQRVEQILEACLMLYLLHLFLSLFLSRFDWSLQNLLLLERHF